MTLGTFAPKGAPAIADITGARAAVIDVVERFSAIHPRTLQRELGPSEVGEPCARQLAYKLMDGPENPARRIDPWPSFLGIAAHARLADALDWAESQNPGTWLTERRVKIPGVRDGGRGTSDALYIPTWTVVDWKFLGDTTFREIQTIGITGSRKYRTQGHVYGLGWSAAGFPVRHVALGIFGRSKPLSSMFVTSEPFNPAYAAAELERVAQVRTVVEWLRVQGSTDVAIVPPTPGKGCFYCPYRGSSQQGYCEE
jgi:hypothetical protein